MIERNKLGMILFLLSEAVFFLLLILAYTFYHTTGALGATAANALNVVKSALFSVALLSSSATLWQADLCLKNGSRPRARFWLAATVALGLVFLLGQGAEYAHLLRENVTISRNLFGTTFFTLTGFHGLHVAVGLVLVTILLGLSVLGTAREPTPPAMEAISLYWHFVDGVWVVIFSVVYLWGYV
jgi:heme/copper-type cytochrome/quinol oxidase subunit 3